MTRRITCHDTVPRDDDDYFPFAFLLYLGATPPIDFSNYKLPRDDEKSRTRLLLFASDAPVCVSVQERLALVLRDFPSLR